MSSTPAEIGGYRIERELGRGGMGVVYLAHDPRLGRRVALKVLLDPVTDPDALLRFLVEAQAAAKLDHPGIVAVHQVGSEGRNAYLVLDYVEGEGLDAHLARSGPLAPRLAASIVATVAEAIEHAHGRGILHRDLKPANVLLDAAGSPRVTDFGLARELSEKRERLTRTGEVLGTPSYMSPEQALGTSTVTHAADVYALGAILYELLTGRPPFTGSVLAVLSRVVSEPPVAPSRLRGDLPDALERVVLKALEKEPAARYATAAALALDLRRFSRGEAVEARARKGRGTVWLALPLVAVIVAVAVWASGAGSRPEMPPGVAPARPGPAPTAAASSRPAPPEREPVRDRLTLGAPPAQEFKIFPRVAQVAPNPRFSRLHVRLEVGERYRAHLVGGGRWIAVVRDARGGETDGILIDTQTWGTVDRWRSPRVRESVAVSGVTIARLGEASRKTHGIQVVHVKAGEGGPIRETGLSWPTSQHVTSMALSQDGGRVAVGDRGGNVFVFAVAQSEPRHLEHPGPVSALAFDPEGQVLLVGLDPKGRNPDRDQPPPAERFWAWDLNGHAAAKFPPRDRVNQIAVSPTGTLVMIGTNRGELWPFQRTRAGRLLTPPGPIPMRAGSELQAISSIAFDSRGQQMYAACRRSGRLLSYQVASKRPPTHVQLEFEPLSVEVSSDDQFLLLAGACDMGERRSLRGIVEVWVKGKGD